MTIRSNALMAPVKATSEKSKILAVCGVIALCESDLRKMEDFGDLLFFKVGLCPWTSSRLASLASFTRNIKPKLG